MSQVPTVTFSAAIPDTSGGTVVQGIPVSASASEKNANARASGESGRTVASPASASVGPPAPRLRSCVTCRTRKVRCDRMSPCSNCRRANIACIFPSLDQPPRWARRLERIASSAKTTQDVDPGVNQVMDRLRSLEGLVKELSSQLEQAHAATSASGDGSSSANSPESSNHNRDMDQHVESSSATNTSHVQRQFGRLVLGEASRSRYISSGFWSRVNDELNGLKMDAEGLAGGEYDSSGDEASSRKTRSTQELDRTPSERHAFLFRHNLSPPVPDLSDLHPLPSQIPFLLDVFSENVNRMAQAVHMPTVTKMTRDLRGSKLSALSPANEALLFAIYYASITSMEEDDIMTNFSSSKSELNLKYRLGLEHALAKADFLNDPDITLVQAFSTFLLLVRRHDSPRFVWMMTGLAIRMAQALGIHRDGSHFAHLTPFEVEMRRRVWWALCMLDVRASEDQGTDLTITHGSFDTRLPSNFNDADFDPETKEMPKEREGISDTSLALFSCDMCDVTRQMMVVSLKGGTPDLDEQSRLLNEYYGRLERTYLQYSSASGNIAYWVTITIARLVVAKMTLIMWFPVLFSSPNERCSDEMRTKLFIAAIEVAEYNHALNAEQACRHWRWIYQTYTHWYAIVYLLLTATQRPWSPIVERAWTALHSPWLIPAQFNANKNMRIWIPLRKLMAKARRHRDAELERLRRDVVAAHQLEAEDRLTPQPTSSGPFPDADSAEGFRERWRQLVTMSPDTQGTVRPSGEVTAGSSVTRPVDTSISHSIPVSLYDSGVPVSEPGFRSAFPQSNLPQGGGALPSARPSTEVPVSGSGTAMIDPPSQGAWGQTAGPSYNPFPPAPADWRPDFGAWLWADADPSVDVFADVDMEAVDFNMDLDSELDWNDWVESAKDLESSAKPPTSGWP
ncbi:fungal-specific transcription factor domain-containing protein [Whalleya microplaca]|nr:fungal-specific transcription factor domain-containing protein [Whalleya microplaca]